ncbi:MAG: hypothetical protein BRD28_03740 [Bacteroidetes bacterium QH_10_64_37]|nr:MAG: hypothetical protein BRD28_03740 [Bacteroidetes bacterium QH_10_64_37]
MFPTAVDRCPSCDAHREPSDDYCPVCGETLTKVHLSEATDDPWYERRGTLLVLVLLFWPAALYGVYRRGRRWGHPSNRWALGGCLLMAIVWMIAL